MAKLSQKELFDEGLGAVLKRGQEAVTGALGGAVGAVGGALKYGAQHGVDASLGGTIGAAGRGAMKGSYRGAHPWDATKEGWKKAKAGTGWGGEDELSKEDQVLAVYLQDLGYMPLKGSQYGIRGEKEKTLEVVELNYDDKGMVEEPGNPVKPPLRTFTSTGGGSWKENTPKGGSNLIKRTPKNQDKIITSSFSQKNLLRQLHMLQG
jgi:hypothetical protein